MWRVFDSNPYDCEVEVPKGSEGAPWRIGLVSWWRHGDVEAEQQAIEQNLGRDEQSNTRERQITVSKVTVHAARRSGI